MSLLSVDVPEHAGRSLVGYRLHADLGDALVDLLQALSSRRRGHADTGQVALHVGAEHRNPGRRELLGHHLQRHRLASAGRPGDQPMPVGPRQQKALGVLVVGSAAAKEDRVGHHCFPVIWAARLEALRRHAKHARRRWKLRFATKREILANLLCLSRDAK